MKARTVLIVAACLVAWLAPASPVQAGNNEVFLSTDVAQSEATYVVQFVTRRQGRIDKIMLSFPGIDPASEFTRRVPRLGRFMVGGEVGEDLDDEVYAERVTVLSSDTLVVDVKGVRNVRARTTIFLELFNMRNPVAGSHTVQVQTLDRSGRVVETVAPITYWTYAPGTDTEGLQKRVTGVCGPNSYMRAIDASGGVSCQADRWGTGDITAVYTPQGSGLMGGAIAGDVTLSIDGSVVQRRVVGTCPAGNYMRAIDGMGNVTCEPDQNGVGANAVTSANIVDGTITAADVNLAEIQKRVAGSCPTGSSIREINADGSVSCQNGATGGGSVTASVPLVATGSNIALPNVVIGTFAGTFNTGVGGSALTTTNGDFNTATGAVTLPNTSGYFNTANGAMALSSNSTGNDNTASGADALTNNLTGDNNTATGSGALSSNDSGSNNTASGAGALSSNQGGSDNTAVGANTLASDISRGLTGNFTGSGITAVGSGANVSTDGLVNATAIGFGAVVNANNKVRIGNAQVTRIEGQVGFTAVSDRNKKENFQAVDGEDVLKKIRGLNITSWNYIGQDPKEFRHYGPVAQEFYAAFGHDGVGTVGTPTTITSTDIEGILMIAVRALEKRTAELKARDARIRALEYRIETLEREIGTHAVPAKFTKQGN